MVGSSWCSKMWNSFSPSELLSPEAVCLEQAKRTHTQRRGWCDHRFSLKHVEFHSVCEGRRDGTISRRIRGVSIIQQPNARAPRQSETFN